MGWTVGRWKPGGGEFSATVSTGSVAHSASCTMGTGDLSRGVKESGRGVDHSFPPNTEVKEII